MIFTSVGSSPPAADLASRCARWPTGSPRPGFAAPGARHPQGGGRTAGRKLQARCRGRAGASPPGAGSRPEALGSTSLRPSWTTPRQPPGVWLRLPEALGSTPLCGTSGSRSSLARGLVAVTRHAVDGSQVVEAVVVAGPDVVDVSGTRKLAGVADTAMLAQHPGASSGPVARQSSAAGAALPGHGSALVAAGPGTHLGPDGEGLDTLGDTLRVDPLGTRPLLDVPGPGDVAAPVDRGSDGVAG